jgi:hypothetical protein
LVKQLKAEGQREQATTVAAMRRPSWVDWALNVTAVEHAAEVERFADAASLMRDAQRSAVTGRGGVDLRSAMIALRDRTGELARRANAALTGNGRPAALPEITERLAEIATSDQSTDQLRAGRLFGDSGDEADIGFGDIDDGDGAPSAKPKKAKEPAKKPAKKPSEKPAEKPANTSQPLESAPDRTLERRRIDRELKTAERVSHAATRDADRAGTSVRHAKSAVDAATDAVTQAQSGLDRAQRRLQREEAERDAARDKAAAAEAEVARLRRALAELGD